MADIRPVEAFLSFVGTLILVLIVSIKTGGMDIVLSEFPIFILGGVKEIAVNNTTFLVMFTVILATVSLELLCSIGGGILGNAILGKSNSHFMEEMLGNMKEGNHFFKFFVLVVTEELFARWFFLGVLTQVSFLSGTFAFYLLFLIGNGIWALMHLGNFKDKEDQHVLRILPQFMGGIFFTFIFVKYGLLAAILTHFASNAILFSFHKINRMTTNDIVNIVYVAFCGIISYWLMIKPLSDISQWFIDEPSFIILGWEFWDYIKALVFISSTLTVIFGLLLYDQRKPREEDSSLTNKILLSIVGTPIAVILVCGLYYLSGMMIESIPYRIIIIAILFVFLRRDSSGSAMSKTFWTGLPNLYIIICIVGALGFVNSIWFVLVITIIDIPSSFLTKENEQ